MPKRCAVDGCRAEAVSARKLSKSSPMIALFSTPKSRSRLAVWNAVLVANKRQLSSRDVVLSQHFRKEDIETHYMTILADGTIHSLERERWRLQANAVPINLAKNVKCVEEIEEGPADSNSAMKNAALSTITVGTNKPDISLSSVSDTNGTLNFDEKPFTDIDMAMDIEDQYNAYSIECLARDVKGAKWREGWAWSSGASSIEFMRVDRAKLQLTVYCHISANMMFKISAGDTTADRGMDGGPIREIDDLMVLLDMMEKLQPCVGTGHKAEVRAADCSGFLTDAYRKGLISERCPSCTVLRRRLQRRKPIDVSLRKSIVAKKVVSLKRKHKNLQKTVCPRLVRNRVYSGDSKIHADALIKNFIFN